MFINNDSKQDRNSPKVFFSGAKSRSKTSPVPKFSLPRCLSWQLCCSCARRISISLRLGGCHVVTGEVPLLYAFEPAPSVEVWDGAEFCAGKGVLNKCLRHAGYKVCGLDILDWFQYSQDHGVQTSSNPLDMLTPSGMACLAGIFPSQCKLKFIATIYTIIIPVFQIR